MKKSVINIISFIFISFFLVSFSTTMAKADEKVQEPFKIEVFRVENNHDILGISFTPNGENYTYAPKQDGVYPTKISFTVKNEVNKDSEIKLVYPSSKRKKDPVNPSQTVNVFEGNFTVYAILPKDFDFSDVGVSFLACSSARCQPFSKVISSDNIQEFRQISNDTLAMLRASSLENTAFTGSYDTAEVREFSSERKTNSLSVAPTLNSSVNLSALSLDALQSKLTASDDYDFNVIVYNPSLEVTSIVKALIFGFLAGLILNCMPCVLPIVALKIHGFLGANTQNGFHAFREHNIFFSLGILVWFGVLGILLGVIGLTWGQLFQEVWLMLFLCCFVFVLALSLFGLFHLPMLDLRLEHKKEGSEKLQAFTSGLLATLLATPCSGPLLGGVLGFSLTQTLPVLFSIFMAMGIGMAFPYICFAIKPSLVRFMPKAGNWLNTMEHILGFFLIGTSLYLLSILPSTMHFSVIVFLFVLAISAFIWGKWGSIYATLKRKIIIVTCLLVFVISSAYVLFSEKETKDYWVQFTPQYFSENLGKEDLVLKFTADWCPTCKVLEKTVFTNDNMNELTNSFSAKFVYVDMTEFDEQKQKLLTALDSVSIPLLAVFPKENPKNPIIVRDIYTFETVKDVLSRIE